LAETLSAMQAVAEPPRACIEGIPSLFEALAAVPDFRRGQGRRYPLAAILAFGVVATLCGYKSYGAMQEWGRNYGEDLARQLGFTRGRVPSVGTLFTVFSRVDKRALEQAINIWAERVLAILPGEGAVLAGDGKALRGSHARGAADTFLLSVVSQRLGLTLLQQCSRRCPTLPTRSGRCHRCCALWCWKAGY
jgi:hypothetical protein